MEQVNQEEKSELTISDWVTFLSSEKHGVLAAWLSAIALLVALWALNSDSLDIWLKLFTSVVTLLGAFAIYRVSSQRVSRAQKLLNDIMSGKYNDPEKVRDIWFASKKK
jgi:ABC-type nickel/cobalt efflux system permease component RcnA